MAFHQIAVPHPDILSGNYSSEVYAAKLWDVYNKRGSDAYADSKTFFEKTYMTNNLKNILESVGDRLKGKGGGHFRSITTPFGGGKTHTLIALYHKCEEWGAKPIVLVGNELDPKTQTLWGLIEKQLTGKINRLEGMNPRGGEALRSVLEAYGAPVLILIDELLQYVVKADGVRINETTLATQTIAFMQELGEVAGSLPNVCVVVTLPSSTNEQLNSENFARLYNSMKTVAGRTMDTITPVSDTDVPRIIRRRLFSSTDDHIREKAEGIVKDFVDYCEEEGLIPEGKQPSEYREEFLNNYPFLPQVVDVLYKRWGTIPRFQRTRGVLRLLSLVVGSMATSDKQFISLGDFDLSNDTIRQELIEYLEPEFNGVVAKDLVGDVSGASKVDRKIPDQYRGKRLGIRAAAAIFMYSHSGGAEINGAMETEIKRATCERGIPAAQISSVLNLLKSNLFYLSTVNDRYMFTKEANMLKIKVDVMDNLRQQVVDESEQDVLKRSVGKSDKLRTVLWPTDSKDVEDSKPLKLVIMKENDLNLIRQIHDKAGESDRTYRNNMFFLAPSDGERERFMQSLKSKVAWEMIRADPHIKLKDGQAATVRDELKKEEMNITNRLRDYYSVLYVPEKEGLDPDRVMPPLGTDLGIDSIVYEHLVVKEAVSKSMGKIRLRVRYLGENKYVDTANMWESMLSAPGELRPASRNVLETAIVDGVSEGEFGLGVMEDGELAVRSFKKRPTVSFESGEVMIHKSLCESESIVSDPPDKLDDLKSRESSETDEPSDESTPPQMDLKFGFSVPEGQVNNIGQMLLKIASHYRKMDLQIAASDGEMSKHDIEMIRETLRQIGAKFDL